MQIVDTITEWLGVKAMPSILHPPYEGDVVILDVPSYSQTDEYSCGAIAAWSIVETFYPKVDFWKFYTTVNPDPDEGIGPRGIVSALRKFKIGTHARRRLKWEDIKEIIDDGCPMLVGTGREIFEFGDHWNVLYGYGKRPDRVFLGNVPGLLRNQEVMSFKKFSREWNPCGEAIVCWGYE